MPATKTAATDATVKRQPKDPEASAFASAAQDLARRHGLKSAYLASEARGVLDRLTIEKARGALAIAKDGGEPVRVKLATLRALLAGDKTEDTTAARKVMTELARDMPGTVYARKITVFVLAAAA